MKKVAMSIFIFFALLWGMPAMSADLRVVTLFSPPYAFEYAGEVVGIAADSVREGLRRAGFEAEISMVPWKRALHMVQMGDADAIFNAVMTPERESFLYFANELLILEETVAFKRTDSSVVLNSDLSQDQVVRLGIGSGFSYGEKLDSVLQKSQSIKVESAPSVRRNIEKLMADRIDAFLADKYLALYSIKDLELQTELRIVSDEKGDTVVLGASQSYLAFSRKTMSSATAERFSRALKGMKLDGTFEAILKKYQ